MPKKIKTIIKVNLPAGEATPAPPVGPVLGQHGVPIMDFIKEYNARTAEKKGQIIPAVITVYEDRCFEFVTKLPPVAEMIKKTLSLSKGSGNAGRETAGKLTRKQAEAIAEEKRKDLKVYTIDAAVKIVQGTARSMGVTVEN